LIQIFLLFCPLDGCFGDWLFGDTFYLKLFYTIGYNLIKTVVNELI